MGDFIPPFGPFRPNIHTHNLPLSPVRHTQLCGMWKRRMDFKLTLSLSIFLCIETIHPTYNNHFTFVFVRSFVYWCFFFSPAKIIEIFLFFRFQSDDDKKDKTYPLATQYAIFAIGLRFWEPFAHCHSQKNLFVFSCFCYFYVFLCYLFDTICLYSNYKSFFDSLIHSLSLARSLSLYHALFHSLFSPLYKYITYI